MENILEKLGIYDLLVIIISGLIILLHIIFILVFFYDLPVSVESVFLSVPFILIEGYSAGLFFQEVGHLSRRRKKQQDKLVHLVYKELIDKVRSVIESKTPGDRVDERCQDVYTYAKHYIYTHEEHARVLNNLAHSTLSRSLFHLGVGMIIHTCLCFFISIYSSFINIESVLFKGKWLLCILFLVYSCIFTILFKIRWERFTKYKIEYTFYTFYFGIVGEKQTK